MKIKAWPRHEYDMCSSTQFKTSIIFPQTYPIYVLEMAHQFTFLKYND